MTSLLDRAFTPCQEHAEEWGALQALDGRHGAHLRWHYAADHSAEHGRFHCADCNEQTLATATAYALSRAHRRESAVRRRWWYEQEGYCWGKNGGHNAVYRLGRRYHTGQDRRADCPDCWRAALQRWSKAVGEWSQCPSQK